MGCLVAEYKNMVGRAGRLAHSEAQLKDSRRTVGHSSEGTAVERLKLSALGRGIISRQTPTQRSRATFPPQSSELFTTTPPADDLLCHRAKVLLRPDAAQRG